MIKPGYVGFAYTDAARDQFDAENASIITTHNYPDIVFFGDSLTWYMPLKKAMLTDSFVNRGIPGDCAHFMTKRFVADVVQLQPKRVVILCGINDIINNFMHEKPYQTVMPDECINMVFDDICTMAEIAKTAQIEVFIGSILPIFNPMGKMLDNMMANNNIMRLNQKIASLCLAESYHYIDYHRHFYDEKTGFLNMTLSIDGVHLKKQGYKKFFEILLPVIEGEDKNE